MKRLIYLLASCLLSVTTFAQHMSGGYFHSTFICKDSSVRFVGTNTHGQIGDLPLEQTEPAASSTQIKFVKILGGVNHNVGLDAEGVVYTWGDNSKREIGRLGYAQDAQLQALDLYGIVDIAVGDNFGMALRKDGRVFVWGDNTSMQLANSNGSFISKPTIVESLTSVKKIAAGQSHAVALKYDGTIWSWGNGINGKLANGLDIYKLYADPIQISGLSNVTDLAVGIYHSAFLTEGGKVFMVGYNEFGTLGSGNFINSNSVVEVPNLSNIKTIASGDYHMLALTQDGKVFCWGQNYFGQLGTGDFQNSNIPVDIGLQNITEIAVANYHSFAYSDSTGLFGWGKNDKYQLGDNSKMNRNSPVSINLGCQLSNAELNCETELEIIASEKYCFGESIEMNVFGSEVFEIDWIYDGNVISVEDSMELLNLTPGQYEIQVEANKLGCKNALTHSFEVVPEVSSNFSYSISNDQVLVVNESSGQDSIFWYLNGVWIGSNDTMEFAQLSENMSIELVSSNVCGSDTSINEVLYNGNSEDIHSPQVHIYPNPTSQYLHVDFSKVQNTQAIYICDVNGRKVLKLDHVGNRNIVDLRPFSSGTYTLHLNSEENMVFKIVKR